MSRDGYLPPGVEYWMLDPTPCRCEDECRCMPDSKIPADPDRVPDWEEEPDADGRVCRCIYGCACTAEDFPPNDWDDDSHAKLARSEAQ